MKSSTGKIALGLAVIMGLAQPAQACWTNAAQDAAKIKHLNTMLMVTALRCRNTSANFLPEYNRFVVKHNALIGSQNALLKTQLAQTNGAAGALNALDRMSIGYANSYGTGHRALSCADLKKFAADLSAQPHGVVTLAALADQVVTGPSWSGPACAANIARRR